MKKIRIEGDARLEFYQEIEVTDEEFDILQHGSDTKLSQLLDRKFDLDCITNISDFYIYDLEEVIDD